LSLNAGLLSTLVSVPALLKVSVKVFRSEVVFCLEVDKWYDLYDL